MSDERQRLRGQYRLAWRKLTAGEPLEPLERIVASVVAQHPEYHAMLEDEDALQDDYPIAMGGTNPFLHMGFHVAIQEQVGADRPPGIADLYGRIVRGAADPHAGEHRIIECLAESLWRAQRDAEDPDEQAYLECVRGLL